MHTINQKSLGEEIIERIMEAVIFCGISAHTMLIIAITALFAIHYELSDWFTFIFLPLYLLISLPAYIWFRATARNGSVLLRYLKIAAIVWLFTGPMILYSLAELIFQPGSKVVHFSWIRKLRPSEV